MLTAQSAAPSPGSYVRSCPVIMCSVKRLPIDGEIIEPVLPRSGAMLEFQFASVYDVKALGTQQLRPSWAATVIGPIDAYRVRLILRDHVQSLVVLFKPLGLYRLFGVPISPLTGAGTEGHAVFGPENIFSLSASGQWEELCRSRATVRPIPPPSASASPSARSDRSRHAPVGIRQMQRGGRRKNDRGQRATVRAKVATVGWSFTEGTGPDRSLSARHLGVPVRPCELDRRRS